MTKIKEIDASEAYTEDNALQTIIDNKRNVGLIMLKYQHMMEKVVNNNLNFIEVEQTRHSGIKLSIVYRNGARSQAQKLHNIMKRHGGYVNDQTPAEAYEIGKLLNYTDESIIKYINRIYIKEPNGNVRPKTNIERNEYDLGISKNANTFFIGNL